MSRACLIVIGGFDSCLCILITWLNFLRTLQHKKASWIDKLPMMYETHLVTILHLLLRYDVFVN